MEYRTSDSKLEWLYSLRSEELVVLEKLDVARNTDDPNLQMEALDELQRIYIDFAFSEYLIPMSSGKCKIDYSYYSDWRNGKKIKTIHSEIEKEKKHRKMQYSTLIF